MRGGSEGMEKRLKQTSGRLVSVERVATLTRGEGHGQGEPLIQGTVTLHGA